MSHGPHDGYEQGAPSFISSLRSFYHVTENTNISVTCLASGRPAPNVTWYTKTSRYQLANGIGSATLSLSKIQRNQSGVYECRAINDVRRPPITTKITINVQYKPEMLDSTQNTSSWNGRLLSLQCTARGSPYPYITWYKPDGQLIKVGACSIKDGSLLQIRTTQYTGDYGEYKCRASNLIGSAEAVIHVMQWLIPGPPVVMVTDVKASSINVKWSPPTSNGGSPVIDYKMKVDKVNLAREGMAGGSVVMVGLTRDTEYTVKVFARNVVGYGEAGTITIRTKRQGPPSSPELNIKANATTGSKITLEWSKPDDNGGVIQFYSLYCQVTFPDGHSSGWKTLANMTDSCVLHYTYEGTSPGRTYRFLVTATNQYGESVRDYAQAREVLAWEPGAKNESEPFVRGCESCVFVTAACSTIIAVLLVSNLISLVYIYRKGRSKQESRLPQGARDNAVDYEDPITMNTFDPVTQITQSSSSPASSDVTYEIPDNQSDDVTATSPRTYQPLDRADPAGRGQEHAPREYEAMGDGGPPGGGERHYAELSRKSPEYQSLHTYGNV
ncbi:neural cell adhesion molecule 1-like [Nematostella vectensis]|uniref:neural cell adhesion molecule 1-like n=1 Tax=Nematostella vectensis TaxID=45351 RepID=UPI0020777559|nr:neural cell adhesion molecule 1-like [Nematostella vectensis]